MKLSDFSLLKETDDSYVVGHPKGKSLSIPKKGLSTRAQELISNLKKSQHLDEGGTVESDLPLPTTPEDEQAQELTKQALAKNDEIEQGNRLAKLHPQIGTMAAPSSVEPEKAAEPEATQAIPSPEAPEVVPQQTPSPASSTTGLTESYSTAPLETAKASLAKGTEAEANVGVTEAEAYKNATATIQDLQNKFEVRRQEYQKKDENFLKALMDPSQKINPDRYWQNMSTGSKIAASIGMVIAGIGSGLTHSPNLAVEQLNRAIDQDVDAQKNDQSKTMNLWKMNREAMGNDQQATLATQNQLLTIAKLKGIQAQSSAQGDLAKARNASAILNLDQQIQQNHRAMALMDMGKESSAKDPSVAVPLLVPKEHQAAVFKEIGAAQNTQRMGATIMKEFEDAAKENTVMKTGAGMLRTPGSVYALHQAMQPTFADLEGTVRQAAMDNTFKNITPAPGDSNYTINQKRASLNEYLKSKMSAPVAKGFGIDLSKYKSTTAVSGAYKSGSVVSVKGKQYKVGEDGDTLTPL